jgi:hypothetical protein
MLRYFGRGEEMFSAKIAFFLGNLDTLSGKTTLCQIMNSEGSDKGAGWHNYTGLYQCLFEENRANVRNVLEIGLGTNNPKLISNMGMKGRPGASVRGWERYFPGAKIYGGDIDKEILFFTDVISTFYLDQTDSASVKSFLNNIPGVQFDLVIDDGLHEYRGAKPLLENLISRLAIDGVYVIEDIVTYRDNLDLYYNLFNELNLSGVLLDIPNKINTHDNCLAIIRR